MLLNCGVGEDGEGDDRGWDGWLAWSTQWTWVWASSGRWWRTGKPGVLKSMGLQRAGHDSNWKTATDFIFLGSKVTVDGDCSHEIKSCLLLGRKAMLNLDSVLKSRDITLPTKVCPVKAMFFPVVMYGCESWSIRKTEHQKIDAFELWCWEKTLRVPWTARRSNQSILKEINPEYSLKGLMLKLKLQYFGHLMQRTDTLEKDHDAGKDWRQEESGVTEDETVG